MTGEKPIEILSPLQPHAYLESWYELSNESHFWFKWRLEALMQQLRDLNFPLQKRLKVLDVGCGTGVLRSQIEAATAWEVDATDLDYQALHQAKPGRGRILYYDILEEKEELREQYDVVILYDVLEHIEETQPFIKALLHHIKVKGYLLVNVPALQLLYSYYDEVAGHVKRYNKQTLHEEFLNSPLSIVDSRYWGMVNVPIILARKLWFALSPKQDPARVIQKGMQPPNRLVNEVFLKLMRLEMKVIQSPLIGASVLMVARKDK